MGSRQPKRSVVKVKQELEHLYVHYNKSDLLEWDPLGMVDPTLPDEDFEILSLLAAGLAYGRVEQCRKSLGNLLSRLELLGCSPNAQGIRKIIETSSKTAFSKALSGWKHRLNTHHDLIELFLNLKKIFRQHKSLCALFQACYVEDPRDHIVLYCEKLAPMKKITHPGTGASWFAASPIRGSSCKRFLLWLKWMIRKDEVDPGLWQRKTLLSPHLPNPSSSRLFVPVDTHMQQWARRFNVTQTKNISWKMTEDITNFFLEISPEDPTRYDFAICHQGILKYRKIHQL